MFERFTEWSRQIVVLAQDEARGMKHGYIGSEHILLGLLREEDGLGGVVLRELGLSSEETRAWIRQKTPSGSDPITGHIPFTPRAKKILELALREALSLGHNYIGTEHILLGLLREEEGIAALYLKDKKLGHEMIRQTIIEKMTGRVEDPNQEILRSLQQIKAAVAAIEQRLAQQKG